MAIEDGQTLLHYTLTRKIGEGGMGAVWLARDTSLDRDVAIKVLPESFADDPERMARFEREAKLLASLNHPNIAAVYGLHEARDGDGSPIRFIAMEYVPGEDLAERLHRGALPMDEAIEIARKIAVGMAAAHDGGTIHRDLKPANVRMTPAGEIKVLDFGLARAADTATDGDSDHSPTITSAGTRAGMLMGTAAYMSPEQARGRAVDRRADVWAFGCVLYECLTGRRAFPGETITDILAEILKTEPNLLELPAGTPAAVRRLLRRCLAKDPAARQRDLGDAALVLADAEGDDPDARAIDEPGASPLPSRGLSRGMVAAIVVAGVVAGFAAGAVLFRGDSDSTDTSHPAAATVTTAGVVPLPDTAKIAFGSAPIGYDSPMLAISANGRDVVYVGQDGDGSRLYRHDLSTFDPPEPISGTEGALMAFFSPRENAVGFFTNDTLARVDLNGDRFQTLGEVHSATRAMWGDDGFIYVGDSQARNLWRVPESGGEPEPMGTLPNHALSDVLPGGAGVLYHRKEHTLRCDFGKVFLHEFGASTEASPDTDRVVLKNAFDARIVGDRIVFMRGSDLLAARFDVDRGEVVGEPEIVVRDVAVDSIFGQAQVALSRAGTLVYLPGGDRSLGTIAWVDRDGQRGTLPVEPRVYGTLDLDPTDRRIAVHVGDIEDYIWLYDLDRKEGRELPSAESSGWPMWNSAGDAVTYLELGETFRLLEQRVDERTAPHVILDSEQSVVVGDWSPDDRWVAASSSGTVLVVDRDGNPACEPFRGGMPHFSPDGRWLAHGTDQAGVYETVVRSWPDGDRVYSIQSDGGIEGMWSADGEMFYRKGDRWYAVQMTFGDKLTWTPPTLAFEIPFLDTPGRSYDVTADGNRMYTIVQAVPDVADRIHVVSGL